jgi:dynein light intermediate chain 1
MEAGVGGSAGAAGANLGASVGGTSAADRRLSRGARPASSTLSTAGPAVATGAHLGRPPISPTIPSPNAAGGQTQHEVLQNFFQSLLSSKDRAGASAAAQTKTSPPKTNGTGATEEGTG